MNGIWHSAWISIIVGIVGTGVGGAVACLLRDRSERASGRLLGIATGVMLAVVVLSVIPESYETVGFWWLAGGLAAGALALFLLHGVLEHDHSSKMVRMGSTLWLGIAVHNFPEGLAIGAALSQHSPFCFTLCALVMLHNIPVGLALAAPFKLGGMKNGKVILATALSGLPMVAGAILGGLLGQISSSAMGILLAFAGGAMLFLTIREMIPETVNLETKKAWLPIVLGFAIGAVVIALA